MISIKDIDKAKLLMALFDKAKNIPAHGFTGIFAQLTSKMTAFEAEELLEQNENIHYIAGRAIFVDFSKDIVDPKKYNQFNGPAEFEMVVGTFLSLDDARYAMMNGPSIRQVFGLEDSTTLL